MNKNLRIVALSTILLVLAVNAVAERVYVVDRYPEDRGMRRGEVVVYEHALFIPGHWEEVEVPVWGWNEDRTRWVILSYQRTRIWIQPHTRYWITRRWHPTD